MEKQDDALCVRRGTTSGLSDQQAPEWRCRLPQGGVWQCRKGRGDRHPEGRRGSQYCHLSGAGEVTSHGVQQWLRERGGLDSGRLWTC